MSKQENARQINNDAIEETIKEAIFYCAGRLAGQGSPDDAKAWADNAWKFRSHIRMFMQRRHTIRKKATR